MVKRAEKGGMGSFSRGAELWMHQARMFTVAVLTVAGISILLGLCAGVFYFFYSTTTAQRYGMERNLTAHTRVMFEMTNAKMEYVSDGKRRMLPVAVVVSLTQDAADDGLRVIRNSGRLAALFCLATLIIFCLYWWHYGRGRMTDNVLRGATLLTGQELKALLEAREDTSPYTIAGVPMRKGSENLHTLIAGAQGTGKSLQFFAHMKQVRARGKRAIVYDPTGEYTQAFFREGVDILMNPLDARSPNWNIWNDVEKDYHFDSAATGLIPDPAEADPFWAKAGRMVLKDVFKVLGREGRRTNRALYNAIAKSSLEEMAALLAGTAGATYVDPKTERTGMSLKMTVQNQLESFRFLHDDGEPFSIRKWIANESDSWLFITAREELRDALSPVLSLWIDTAMKAVLNLEAIHRERLWFYIDELPTLHKLDILKLVLTNTRKYGLCCFIGVQDFSQLYEIYGHDLAKTIISGCQTKLLLRVTDGEAAKQMAVLFGTSEIDEKDETLSYGLSASRDGISIVNKRSIRDLILSSQILGLPDLTGYLIVPGDYPIGRVAYEYVETPKTASGFVERDGLSVRYSSGVQKPSDAGSTSREPTKIQNEQSAERELIDVDTGRPVASDAKVSLAKAKSDTSDGKPNHKKNPLADAL